FPYLIDPSLHRLFWGLLFYANPVPLGKRLIYLDGVELPIVQLHFYRPAPHCQLHIDLVGVFRILRLANLLHLTFHVLERAVADLDPVANSIGQLLRRDDDLLLLALLSLLHRRLFSAAEHRLHFAVGHRLRSPGQAAADKVAHSRRLAEQIQDRLVVLDLGHDVAGELLLLADLFLTLALAGLDDHDLTLHRHHDLAEERFHTLDLHTSLNRLLD